jgi:hypothetical protein
MGHANPAITLRIYAHWVPGSSRRRAVNQFPNLHPISTLEEHEVESENFERLQTAYLQ